MSTQQRIQDALEAIANARQCLQRLKPAAADDAAELNRALRGLRDATEILSRAVRDTQE